MGSQTKDRTKVKKSKSREKVLRAKAKYPRMAATLRATAREILKVERRFQAGAERTEVCGTDCLRINMIKIGWSVSVTRILPHNPAVAFMSVAPGKVEYPKRVMPDNPITFDTILQLLEQQANLPLGTLRALGNFDLSDLIDERTQIHKKDLAQITGFVPAVLQRAADLGVSVGFDLGRAYQEFENNGSIPDPTVVKGEGFDQLVKEAMMVVETFFNQAKDIAGDGLDPFKNERQIARIFAKRNQLNAAYQDLLGVSEGTPTEYPA